MGRLNRSGTICLNMEVLASFKVEPDKIDMTFSPGVGPKTIFELYKVAQKIQNLQETPQQYDVRYN